MVQKLISEDSECGISYKLGDARQVTRVLRRCAAIRPSCPASMLIPTNASTARGRAHKLERMAVRRKRHESG